METILDYKSALVNLWTTLDPNATPANVLIQLRSMDKCIFDPRKGKEVAIFLSKRYCGDWEKLSNGQAKKV